MKWAMRLMVVLAAVVLPLTVLAQVANENLANGLIAARQKNTAMMASYTWYSRLDIFENGSVQDIRLEQVTMGPGGQPQRTVINDQPGQLPRGFFRKAVDKANRKDLAEYVKGVEPTLDQYLLSSAGKVIDFISKAQVMPGTTPDGKPSLSVNGSGVVVPGDTVQITFNAQTLLPMSMSVSTTVNGDPITISASFRTNGAGLNHLQYATVTMPAKNASINIHNYDYSNGG